MFQKATGPVPYLAHEQWGAICETLASHSCLLIQGGSTGEQNLNKKSAEGKTPGTIVYGMLSVY